MTKISVDFIDEIAEEINALDSEASEQLIEKLSSEQPAILQYLFSEQFAFLSKEGKEILLLTTLVLWQICKRHYGTLRTVAVEQLDKIQDANWTAIEKLEIVKGQTFEEQLEPLIADYAQSELLYFSIDSIEEGTDAIFNKHQESKTPIFIGLKSIVDALMP